MAINEKLVAKKVLSRMGYNGGALGGAACCSRPLPPRAADGPFSPSARSIAVSSRS